MLLEKRVEVLQEALEMKDAQLGEVLAAAHLDPATLQQVRVAVCTPACAMFATWLSNKMMLQLLPARLQQ